MGGRVANAAEAKSGNMPQSHIEELRQKKSVSYYYLLQSTCCPLPRGCICLPLLPPPDRPGSVE